MKATLGATLCLLSPAAPEPCQSGDGAKAGRFTTAGSDREEADAEEEVAEEEVVVAEEGQENLGQSMPVLMPRLARHTRVKLLAYTTLVYL